MSQTLLIHNNLSFIDLLKLNLTVYVGTDVIVKKSFNESKTLMEHHPGIDLVICADEVDGEQTADLTYKFYQEKKATKPLIVTGRKCGLTPSEQVKILPMQTELPVLLQVAAQFLNVTPKSMVEKIVPEFFPLSSYYCLNLEAAPCDIYLVDEKGNYQLKCVQGSPINGKEFLHLVESGTAQVFVHAQDRLKFVNQVSSSLNAILKDDKTDPQLRLNVADKSFQMLQEQALYNEADIEASVKVLAISAIKTCMEIAKHNPRVANLIRDLLSNRSSFRFKHVQLIIYVCNHIVSRLDWGSSEVKEKLAFVTFFHDIFLTDDRLARLNAFNVAEATDLTKEEKDLVHRHALLAAEVIQKFPVAPIGSDVIIMQHHGMVRGLGFTENFPNDLSPLAIIFIVAEEFAQMIIDCEDVDGMGAKKGEMIAALHQKFTKSKFKKIVDLLDTITF